MQLDILETKLWKTNKKWGKKFYDQQKWNQNINKDLKNIATTISERANGREYYVLAVSKEKPLQGLYQQFRNGQGWNGSNNL